MEFAVEDSRAIKLREKRKLRQVSRLEGIVSPGSYINECTSIRKVLYFQNTVCYCMLVTKKVT